MACLTIEPYVKIVTNQEFVMEKFCSCCSLKFDKKANEKECSIKCRMLNRIIVQGDCWVWNGPINPKTGYGLLRNGKKTQLVHRLMYECFSGEIPEKKIVCHSCDNRLCINPDHLWIGSHSDNIQDCIHKKRSNPPIGEKNGNATLKQESVMEIKKLLDENMNQHLIAEKFKINQSTVSDIKRKKLWKHI